MVGDRRPFKYLSFTSLANQLYPATVLVTLDIAALRGDMRDLC